MVTSAIERNGLTHYVTPERYQRIGELFDEALERAPTERAEWLRQACDTDDELYAAVEDLLAHHSEAEAFLSRPALEIAAAQTPSLIGQQLGHYRILSLLGAGGMGEVYLAEDATLRRKIALKVLPAYIAKDQEHLRRFKQEALAASALNHPNIVTIHEFGTEGDTHFLVTELVEGETLRDRLRHGAVSLNAALDLTHQIANALQAAHEAGIIHRDIKPENVMIRRDGLVKVLDFGLAKLTNARRDDAQRDDAAHSTEAGTVLGTVAYMSPEQARGQRVDARSDLFSLGVVFYEMLTGSRPFNGETPSHTIVAILEKEPTPLSSSLSAGGHSFPGGIELIVKQMLAKEVAQRYPDARVLLTDVKKLQQRLTVESEAVETRHAIPLSELATLRHSVKHTAPVNANLPKANVTSQPASRRWLWLLSAVLLAALFGAVVWQSQRGRPAASITANVTAQPERRLSYFLTVQKYRDGKPYQAEFQAAGREIFEPGWRFKLNVTSPQDGFLYLLNEEPNGGFALLFPLPSRNQGSARLIGNERFQTNWYLLDDKTGTERFLLVWAAQPVPELEAVRSFVNPQDQGRITDAKLSQAVKTFIERAAANPIERVNNSQARQTEVSGRGPTLVALVELEHH